MTRETIEIVSLPDADIWSVRSGSGPALIWLHGGPGLWDMAGPLAAATDDLVTSYRYEQRGAGRSTGIGPHTVARYVADLEALRRYWALDRMIVAGHSWGATLALHYALALPERVRGLIYLCGTGIDPGWRAGYRAESARRRGPEGEAELARRERAMRISGTLEDERAYCRECWKVDFADSERGYAWTAGMFVGNLRVNFAANAELDADNNRVTYGAPLDAAVARLPMPALILHGSHDPRPPAARAIAELMPCGTFRLIENGGHLPWFEQPALVRDALRSFIQRTLSAG